MTETINTVTVTIGRNIKGTPMPAARWEAFEHAVRLDLQQYAETIDADSYWTEHHAGVAPWQGVLEDSIKVTLLWSGSTLAELPAHRADLRADLAQSAAVFEQDAIALAFGTSELVSPVVAANVLDVTA